LSGGLFFGFLGIKTWTKGLISFFPFPFQIPFQKLGLNLGWTSWIGFLKLIFN